ncbi:hypothetical protein [Marinobacter sp.]|uniref:hypothetical protein n=1 Tax=Marinobacter sp. TaxID=50741 RepID=UPI002B276B95|nr:hypothetical protein [Marinobacter sp.]
MLAKVCCFSVVVLAASNAMATDAETDLGISGVDFERDTRTSVRKIFDEQAEQPRKGGELSMALYAKTQKRLADSFDQAMPDRINESSSGE